MTIEAPAEVISPKLLQAPFGVMAANLLLEAIAARITKEITIKEQTDPIEAMIRMDPISSAILRGRIKPEVVHIADRRALLAEVLTERRQGPI